MLMKVGRFLINPEFILHGEQTGQTLQLVFGNDDVVTLKGGEVDDFYSAFARAVPRDPNAGPPLAEAVTDYVREMQIGDH